MRLLPTAIVLLSALYASAHPANQGQVLECETVMTGAQAAPALKASGLPPPNNMSLLVGEGCEPLIPFSYCDAPFPLGLYCDDDRLCLCCEVEEEMDPLEGYIGVDCVQVLKK